MQGSTLTAPFKAIGYLVVGLMAAAVVYASYIVLSYWNGIGV